MTRDPFPTENDVRFFQENGFWLAPKLFRLLMRLARKLFGRRSAAPQGVTWHGEASGAGPRRVPDRSVVGSGGHVCN